MKLSTHKLEHRRNLPGSRTRSDLPGGVLTERVCFGVPTPVTNMSFMQRPDPGTQEAGMLEMRANLPALEGKGCMLDFSGSRYVCLGLEEELLPRTGLFGGTFLGHLELRGAGKVTEQSH